MAKDKKSSKKPTLQEVVDYQDEIKRLNRVIGQMEGLRRMLEDGAKVEKFIMQSKAVHSALKSIESRVLANYLEVELNDVGKIAKKKARNEKIIELASLFKQAS